MSSLINWVATGDSLTATIICWPYQYLNVTSVGDGGLPDIQAACTYYGTNIIMRDMAITGTRLNTNGYPDLVPLTPIYIDPVISNKSVTIGSGTTQPRNRKYFLTCSIGSNDGGISSYATPALYAAAVASWAAARKTAGWDAVAMSTLLPRGDGLMTEPNRAAYNNTLTGAGWAATHGIDYIIDFASDSIMGASSNLPVNGGSSLYYSSDSIHPTSAGQARLVPIFSAVMASVLAL